jgi:hypothetical protein
MPQRHCHDIALSSFRACKCVDVLRYYHTTISVSQTNKCCISMVVHSTASLLPPSCVVLTEAAALRDRRHRAYNNGIYSAVREA